MTNTLVLPDWLAAELVEAADNALETAAILLAHPVPVPGGGLRLLGHALRWVPDQSYSRRECDSLSITSDGYVPALAEAESTRSVAFFLHTHPGEGASPRPSRHDDEVDRNLFDLFRIRTGSDLYASIVIGTWNGGLTFTGRIYSASGVEPITRLWVVGDRWELIHSDGCETDLPQSLFDRQIRAFGGAVQRVLGDLDVSVVGCGGTGSAVAEQLVRLGVRQLRLFDPDTLSESNLTRVYGSFAGDAGKAKPENLAAHLMRIAPDLRVALYASMITLEPAARQLLPSDLIFCCTDDNAGRLVLSRYAAYLLTPVIDCGVLLSSSDTGTLQGIDGRVTVMAPGLACLICRDRIDTRRAASELLSPNERVRRINEGYAPALADVEPAVVTYTSLVASVATSELLERLIHYGPAPRPSEVLLRCHEREVSTNIVAPRLRHYCHPDSGKLGQGITSPYLDQTWPS